VTNPERWDVSPQDEDFSSVVVTDADGATLRYRVRRQPFSPSESESTEVLTAAQIGWVAGLIDVRGYLSDRPSSHADRRLPTVAITLADVAEGEPSPIISWLCEHTGVAPIAVGKGYNRAGCGEHCPQPHVHITARYHRWIVGGAKAVAVLRAVEPVLIAKQGEARRLIGMAAAYKGAHVRDMERRGWISGSGALA
jgi:hypothetical protein